MYVDVHVCTVTLIRLALPVLIKCDTVIARQCRVAIGKYRTRTTHSSLISLITLFETHHQLYYINTNLYYINANLSIRWLLTDLCGDVFAWKCFATYACKGTSISTLPIMGYDVRSEEITRKYTRVTLVTYVHTKWLSLGNVGWLNVTAPVKMVQVLDAVW